MTEQAKVAKVTFLFPQQRVVLRNEICLFWVCFLSQTISLGVSDPLGLGSCVCDAGDGCEPAVSLGAAAHLAPCAPRGGSTRVRAAFPQMPFFGPFR